MKKYFDNTWMVEEPNSPAEIKGYQRWVRQDEYYNKLPQWTCNCILGPGALQNSHKTSYSAHEKCPNCGGRGFMPIPPSEVT